MVTRIFAILAGVCCLTAVTLADEVSPVASPEAFPQQLREVTGAHTRALWTRPLRQQGNMQHEDGLELWGLDSDDNQGPRKIGESDSYHRPLFTADGQRIVWTDYPERQVNVINFDGTGRKTILETAQMGDVWRDPETGIDWVYYRELAKGEPKRDGHLYEGGKMYRTQLDNPEVRELMWDLTSICHGSLFYLSLTDDGKYAASAFPWAGNGVAQLPNQAYQQWHFGCWSGLSPDGSGRFFSFDGDHRYLHVFDWGGENHREVRLDTMPENTGNRDVYYPRWTNHPDFIVVSYLGNTYLAKIDEGFTKIASYTLIAKEKVPGWLGYPDVWIDRGPTYQVTSTESLRPLDAVADLGTEWPGVRDGLVFAWANRKAQNRVPTSEGASVAINLQTQGRARFGRYWEMLIDEGAFIPTSEDTASRVVDGLRKGKAMTLEFTINPAKLRQDGTMFALETKDGTPNLRVYQWLNRANFDLPRSVVREKGDKAGEPMSVYSLVLSKSGPTHVVFTFEGGKVDAYSNGEYVSTIFLGGFNGWKKDDFAAWADSAQLIFGRRADGSDPWSGTLEGVAIFSRALTSSEVKQQYTLYSKHLEGRTDPQRVVIEGRLLEKSGIPSEQDLGVYNRALVVNEYAVEKVIQGSFEPKNVVVQQWAVLDRQVLPEAQKWQVGQTYRLTLEPAAQHPELEGERLFHDVENLIDEPWLEVGGEAIARGVVVPMQGAQAQPTRRAVTVD